MDESNPNPYRALEVENESLNAPGNSSEEPNSLVDFMVVFFAVGFVGAATALLLYYLVGTPLGRSPFSLPALIGLPGIAAGTMTFRVTKFQRRTIAFTVIVSVLAAATFPLCTFFSLGQMYANLPRIRSIDIWTFVCLGLGGCVVCIPIALFAGWRQNKKANQAAHALAESMFAQKLQDDGVV